jgi:ribosomal protein S3AE
LNRNNFIEDKLLKVKQILLFLNISSKTLDFKIKDIEIYSNEFSFFNEKRLKSVYPESIGRIGELYIEVFVDINSTDDYINNVKKLLIDIFKKYFRKMLTY